MPSKSWRQARLMAKAAADPDYAEERNIPQHVAQEFTDDDRRNMVYFDDRGNLISEAEAPAREAAHRAQLEAAGGEMGA